MTQSAHSHCQDVPGNCLELVEQYGIEKIRAMVSCYFRGSESSKVPTPDREIMLMALISTNANNGEFAENAVIIEDLAQYGLSNNQRQAVRDHFEQLHELTLTS